MMFERTARLLPPVALATSLIFLPVGMAARAQTAFPPRPAMPTAAPAAPAQTAKTGPAMPVPVSVVNQARDQAAGNYGTLARPRTSGQVQRAWDEIETDESVYTVDLCEACTYKVRLREYMVTVIELPKGEAVEAVDVGDKEGFAVSPRGKRRLAVRPAGQGYDSNMTVYGKSGRVYAFYLRAEGFNSRNVPDLVVRLGGSVNLDTAPVIGAVGDDDKGNTAAVPPMALPPGSDKARAVDGLTRTNPGTPNGDFVAEAPFDPNALRGWGEYELWGSEELKPETVFRDDRFTYIRFGKRWKDIELPTAYVVVDGIDELVNTRVQGETYIVESTRPLITLKSGKSFLCLRNTGGHA